MVGLLHGLWAGHSVTVSHLVWLNKVNLDIFGKQKYLLNSGWYLFKKRTNNLSEEKFPPLTVYITAIPYFWQGFSKNYSQTEILAGQRRRASLVRNLRTARKLSTPGQDQHNNSITVVKLHSDEGLFSTTFWFDTVKGLLMLAFNRNKPFRPRGLKEKYQTYLTLWSQPKWMSF